MQCYVDMAAMGKAETIEKVHFCRSEEGGHGEDDDKNETMQDKTTSQYNTRPKKETITRQNNTTQHDHKTK